MNIKRITGLLSSFPQGPAIRSRMLSLITLFLSLVLFQALQAQPSAKQKKEQLQQQMKKLQDEIKLMEAAAAKTSAKKEKNMDELLSLQAKIKTREKLIANMNSQIDDLNETISETALDIDSATIRVGKMKADYAAMLRKTFENLRFQNELAFFLSSTSFYDAIQRYNYLLKVDEYRREQAKQLQESIEALQQKKDALQDNKDKKLDLLQKQTTQKSKLEKEKKEKDETVAVLQQKEQSLRKQIAEKNKAAQQLNNKIQAIIEEEIKQAKKKAEEEARRAAKNASAGNKKPAGNISMTPADQALSKDFADNQGKLPWPVERGDIISEFGKHEHPVLKGVMIENNGVDIKTTAGANARAVFGGTVVSTFFLPTTQNCIIVKHGEYFTVYSNIETVTVKPGDVLTTKQSLGKLHTDKGDGVTKVHLEIWKGKDKTDPEQWLVAK